MPQVYTETQIAEQTSIQLFAEHGLGTIANSALYLPTRPASTQLLSGQIAVHPVVR
jgi:hypothetical protein